MGRVPSPMEIVCVYPTPWFILGQFIYIAVAQEILPVLAVNAKARQCPNGCDLPQITVPLIKLESTAWELT